MSPYTSAITFRCVSVNVESLSLEPPMRDTIHSSNVILALFFNLHLIGSAPLATIYEILHQSVVRSSLAVASLSPYQL
ncbi:hypothetical protein Tco_1266371 [Tanacetum coccineum]